MKSLIGEKAKNLGLRGFLMKPVLMNELAKTIRNVMDSS